MVIYPAGITTNRILTTINHIEKNKKQGIAPTFLHTVTNVFQNQ